MLKPQLHIHAPSDTSDVMKPARRVDEAGLQPTGTRRPDFQGAIRDILGEENGKKLRSKKKLLSTDSEHADVSWLFTIVEAILTYAKSPGERETLHAPPESGGGNLVPDRRKNIPTLSPLPKPEPAKPTAAMASGPASGLDIKITTQSQREGRVASPHVQWTTPTAPQPAIAPEHTPSPAVNKPVMPASAAPSAPSASFAPSQMARMTGYQSSTAMTTTALHLDLGAGEQMEIQLTIKDGQAKVHIISNRVDLLLQMEKAQTQLEATLEEIGLETQDISYEERESAHPDHPNPSHPGPVAARTAEEELELLTEDARWVVGRIYIVA